MPPPASNAVLGPLDEVVASDMDFSFMLWVKTIIVFLNAPQVQWLSTIQIKV